MHLIEPCCTQKHLRELRDSIARGGTKQFMGFGDLSLTELLPALLMRYDSIEMMIVAPALPEQATDVIRASLRKQRARRDGRGNLDVISHLTIITDLSNEYSQLASLWQKNNSFGERLKLVDLQQEDTVILLPDIVLYGPINLRYGHQFEATISTLPEVVERFWEKYRKLTEPMTEPEPEPEPAEEQIQEAQTSKKSSRKRKKD